MTAVLDVCHVITGLETGGAETMLAKLCESLDRRRVRSSVVALRSGGPLAPRIRGSGVSLTEVGLDPGVPRPAQVLRLLRIRQVKTAVLHGWMYHGNLGAMVLRGFRSSPPMIWSVRQTLYDISQEKRLTRGVIALNARMAHFAACIVYNSTVSAGQHARYGFPTDRSIVIPNGFDTSLFAPSDEARGALRAELHLPPDQILIGLVARFHPMKDHETFWRAAAIIGRGMENVTFVVVGAGMTESLQCAAVTRHALEGRVAFLGPRADVHLVTAALDIACSSSAWGEGFPNALGEAMACGVSCVTTDVGDSAYLVGGGGIVVPPRDAEALAAACHRILASPERRRMGEAGRKRIMQHFTMKAVASRYADLYESVAAGLPVGDLTSDHGIVLR